MLYKLFSAIKNNRWIRGLAFSLRQNFGYSRRKFGYIEDGVTFTPPITIINPKNVYIYSSTDLGGCYISALNADFILKKGCAVAEGLTVHTGNHGRVIGQFVGDITEKEKPSGLDKKIVVEEDVWIGANVTLLSGVTVGRGATLAAGAVVSKDVIPYSVTGGVPSKFIKFKWSIDEIIEHEKLLYPENERFSRNYLEKIFAEHNN